ncbi:MAG: hypothetical protein JRN19_04365 [Nitrososphaerota archaeon]|nr:hypothetical protein [Nitrososphaerota archaeon]MDG7051665.1 hypothetical protein [Nitrososphaerota archaeon]
MGRRRGQSEIIGAVILIFITVVFGIAIFSWGDSYITNLTTGYINNYNTESQMLNQRFMIEQINYINRTLGVFIGNFGQTPITVAGLTIQGGGIDVAANVQPLNILPAGGAYENYSILLPANVTYTVGVITTVGASVSYLFSYTSVLQIYTVPPSATVLAGNTANATVFISGTAQPVNISIYGLPAGASASLTNTSFINSPSGLKDALAIATSPLTPYGTYRINITASGEDGQSANTTFTLTVTGYTFELSYSAAGSGYTPPTFGYYGSGNVSTKTTLSTTPTVYLVEPGTSWNVTNPLGGSTSQMRWVTSQTTSGLAESNLTIRFAYQEEYYLTMVAGTGGTVAPSSGWVNAGQSVTITATPSAGYSFSSWTGTGAGSYSGPNNPATITMNGPITEIANFNNGITFTTTGMSSSATGTVLIVNGTSYSYSQLPFTIYVSSGNTLTYSWTSNVSGGTGIEYLWQSTSGLSTSQSGTLTVSSPGSIIGNYQEEYRLTMGTNSTAGGSVSPSSGWFKAGQSVSITATANSGYKFSSWTGTGTGSYSGPNNPATITMNGPITEIANFYATVSISLNPSTYTPPKGPPPPNTATTVATITGGSQSVTLTVTGAPGGSTITWTQNPITDSPTGVSDTLTIAGPIPPGGYTVTVTATGADGQTATATFTVT